MPFLRSLTVWLALIAATPALGETITVTSQYGPGRPQTVFWEVFRDRIGEALPGRFNVRIVTGGALGGEKEEAQAIRLGSIDGALSTVANLTTWVPEGAALDLPFIFDGPEHILAALDGPAGERLIAAYGDEQFIVPAFIIFGARHVIGDAPFETPADLEGVTVRSLQADLHVAFWRALGANPTTLAITEAYGALSNGVVDAMDMTMSGYDALKLFEAAPVLSETAHIWAIGVVYFSAEFWSGLTAAEQDAVASAANEAAVEFNRLAADEQASAMARTTEKGATRVSVNPDPWRAALSPFVNDYVSQRDDARLRDVVDAIKAARTGE
ncbi:MAG: TRAP transporter substrate-binding protein [Pseudomonadota bacterium]